MNPPTANRTPSTRPRASAWLDTSITTASTPCSTISANIACSCGASGVVSALGTRRPPMRVSMVPINAVDSPAAASPASTRYEVVVLPEVPVIPTMRSRSEG